MYIDNTPTNGTTVTTVATPYGFYQLVKIVFPVYQGQLVAYQYKISDGTDSIDGGGVGYNTTPAGASCYSEGFLVMPGGWDTTGATTYKVTVAYAAYPNPWTTKIIKGLFTLKSP